MNTMLMRTRAAAAALLAAAAALLAGCDGGRGLLSPDRAWVAIDPVQCLGNPWEQDWLANHGGGYSTYPLDPASQNAIIRGYYARFGVEVRDIISIPKYEVVCRACSCPRGDALYMYVRDSDVGIMIGMGFRRESPGPLPFPRDSTLLGPWRYTGYDSTGTLPLIQGTLTFLRRETTFVAGVWNLRGPDGYGDQIGTGPFEGEIRGNVVGLNLNPGWYDNNVVLLGELKAGTYSGHWEVITIVGPVYTGTFEAVKISGE